jgi:hypothetical protein
MENLLAQVGIVFVVILVLLFVGFLILAALIGPLF